MRLKNVPGSREDIEASPYAVTEPEQYRGRWNTLFEKEQPLHVEIGMGKGQFLMGMAQAHPDINYLGIEKFSSVLIRAVQKQEELQLPNLILIRMDAEFLEQVFAEGELDRIYLNFSDPWPKDRHAKRRLTSGAFLARYNKIMKKDGQIEFKTDNDDLFAFSLESIQDNGWELTAVTDDLHHSDMAEGNIMTEYEERFSAKGNPIHKLICERHFG